MNGGRVSIWVIYAGVALMIAGACLLNAFSVTYDLARVGRPRSLWEPLVWETTSAAMLIATLTLPRRGAILVGTLAKSPLAAALSILGLALAFSAFHIIGMVLLRKLAYAAVGAHYWFNWSIPEIFYELRKDLFAFGAIVLAFWLAERAFGIAPPLAFAPVANANGAPDAAAQSHAGTELWLRDGRTSILVNPPEILWVASAGNYVEYALVGGRRHLIRTTLQAEEARLSRFGIARVHRTRLINPMRIIAIAWRPSGDFELCLDTGETVVGSRRYKTAIAALAG
jgi:DNA-binding LytR/AlgR family response regulator